MVSISAIAKKLGKGPVAYPPDHEPGMRVPLGGSSCKTCEYYKGNNKCGNKYFIKWMGSDNIPAPADQYCSDWYEWDKK